MKLTSIALGFALVGASSVYATPYYVGQNLRPENNVALEFQDTVTKEIGAIERGNIAAFELKGDFSPMENLSVGANFPFFMTSKNASAIAGSTESRNAIGNVGLNGNWSMALSDSSSPMTWGYAAGLGAFMPTSRKVEGGAVAVANPTTDFFTYSTKTTTIHPNIGLFAENEMFSAKTNLGYGWSYIGGLPEGSDRNRNSFTWQAAASWKAMPNLSANLEYNTITLDKATVGTAKRFRHAIAPGVSGNIAGVLASAFVSLPLDKTTRDIHNVAFGLNAGYMF